MRNQLIENNTDFKKYFLEEDNLRSLQGELVFSILRRYNCFAGCKVCYVDKYFETNKDAYSRYIPTEITNEISDKWLNLFDNYLSVNTIDDLYWMKTQQPHLFKWYQEHSSLFYFGAMTDNSFIRSWKILYEDIPNPKGIYEFTFSDVWLSKIRVNEIIESLDKLSKRFEIIHIKFIQSDINSLEWDCVKSFINWVKSAGLNLSTHHNAKVFDTIRLPITHQQENFASYNGDLYTVCGEADYIQYDSFFLTLVDAINPLQTPYNTLDEYDIATHMSKHLKAKIDVYNRYAEQLKFVNSDNTMYYRNYFKWISENLVVNDNYNFIPVLSLNNNNKSYNKLVNAGWTSTKYGLIKPTNNVIPLFSFK